MHRLADVAFLLAPGRDAGFMSMGYIESSADIAGPLYAARKECEALRHRAYGIRALVAHLGPAESADFAVSELRWRSEAATGYAQSRLALAGARRNLVHTLEEAECSAWRELAVAEHRRDDLNARIQRLLEATSTGVVGGAL